MEGSLKVDKIKLELAADERFLDAVMKKFHFSPEDRACFLEVGDRVSAAAHKEAGFWYMEREESALAVMTLGAGVDALQEQYAKECRLTECYMAETVAGELLLNAYREFNRWVEAHTGRHVARYRFFGAQEDDGALSLEAMSGALRAFGIAQVQCNQACCLTPKKSVIFLAELTPDAGVRCEGICVGCGRKDCPNRCDREQEAAGLRWPDLSGRPLPYGYARILGR